MTQNSSEALADLQQDTILLQERLAESQRENHILRRQLHSSMALLDVAVSRLAKLGFSLETPMDIRALRADAMRHTDTSGGGHKEARDGEALTSSGSASRKFHLFKTLQHHTKAVHCCCFAPGDTEVLASGGLDRQLILQNFTKPDTKLWSINAHRECISEIAWLSANYVVSVSYDGMAKVWDSSRDGAAVYQYQAESLLLSATPLDKSNVFAVSDSRQNVAFVDIRAHKPTFVRENSSRVNSLAYDSSAYHLFMGQSDGCITVWDIRRSGAAVSAVVSEDPSGSGGHHTATSTASASNASFHGMKRVWTAPNSDAAHSGVAHVAHVHSDDDTKRLVSVTNDHVVRLYSGTLNAPSSGSRGELYALHTALPRSLEMRGYGMRAAFWKGVAPLRPESPLYDDGEKDADMTVPRRVTECDLLITGGTSNRAMVFDVSEAGAASVVQTLDGHRDRVTGAAVHHTKENLIVATSSADATIRVWLPAKS